MNRVYELGEAKIAKREFSRNDGTSYPTLIQKLFTDGKIKK